MGKVRGLLKASHFGPTLLVTTISWFFAAHYRGLPSAFLIAFGVFTGQLIVGWSNDLYDYEYDQRGHRSTAP